MVYGQKWARVVVRWCMARKPSYYCCDRSLTAELRRLTRAGPHIPCHLQSFPISLLSFFAPILCCIFPPPPFPSFSLMPNNTSPDPTTAIYNLYHCLVFFSLSPLYCLFPLFCILFVVVYYLWLSSSFPFFLLSADTCKTTHPRRFSCDPKSFCIFFLATQVSLAPTHVSPLVGHAFEFPL